MPPPVYASLIIAIAYYAIRLRQYCYTCRYALFLMPFYAARLR